MIIEQIYTKCLAQGSYFIASEGQAIVIDPLRETAPYLELCEKHNAEIKYVFETHLHADFVSGHVSLANQLDVPIVFGPDAALNFDAHIARDGDRFEFGALELEVLHTPGHTPESSCFLLYDDQQNQHALFSGDTLFIGDVGRPDLAQENTGLTTEDLAGMLYDSLREKILPLSDHLVVYPAHGAGSACGKNMSKETHDTLGNQKLMNYALQADLSKQAFVATLVEGLEAPPKYFVQNVALNKQGYTSTEALLNKQLKAINPNELNDQLLSECTILDVRHQKEFVKSHLKGSIFIGLDGTFAPWAATILKDVNTPLFLVCDQPRRQEALMRLARVGFDNVVAYLDGSIDQCADQFLSHIDSISAQEFVSKRILSSDNQIIDVRKNSEFKLSHVDEAKHYPLMNLEDSLKNIQLNHTTLVYCAGGYRSVIACSIMTKYSTIQPVNVEGGYSAISKLIHAHQN